MPNMQTMTVYMPTGPDASEHWQIVRGALEDVGITDIRPAPPQSLSFRPRQLRSQYVSTAEI